MNILFSTLFTLGLIFVDVLYVRWAWLSENPRADLPARIVIGIILGLVSALVLWAFIHYVAAALKGSLKLVFIDRPYTWGETITGEVVLRNHKRLQMERLTVTICAQRRISTGDNNHRMENVFKHAQDLPIDSNLLPDTRRIPFSLQIPDAPPRQTPEWPENLKGLGTLIEGINRTFNPQGLSAQLHWVLDVRAHVPGADLNDSRTLRFNSLPPSRH
jgi:hypothetical protein